MPIPVAVNSASNSGPSLPIVDNGGRYRVWSDVPLTNENYLEILDGVGGSQLEPLVEIVGGPTPYAEIVFSARTVRWTGAPNPQNCRFIHVPANVGLESVFPGTNLRWMLADGSRVGSAGATVVTSEGGTNGWAQHQHTNVITPRIANAPNHFAVVTPACARKIKWQDWYVSNGSALNLSTSVADQRNPDSSLYDGTVMQQMVSALDYAEANGFMISLTVTDMHSGHKNSVPTGMINAGLTWQTNVSGQIKVRYDLPGVVDLFANFLYAIQQKFGDHPALYGIVLGEYFLTGSQHFPSGFNEPLFRQNRGRLMWQTIDGDRSVRADGTRLAIYQTHPVLKSGVNDQDLIDNMIGVSESDTNVFQHDVGLNGKANQTGYAGSFSQNIQDVFSYVPTMMNGDARIAIDGRQWVWPSEWVGNGNSPFDHPANYGGTQYRGPALPQELYWYHGRLNAASVEDGPVPLGAIFLRVDNNTIQSEANIRDAQGKFGHGGTLAGTWGAAPADPRLN